MSAAIRARIEEPATVARMHWPVTHGCPFPQGALVDPDQVRLVRQGGEELPLQTAVLARWPDGSVKWLLLDTQVDIRPKQVLPLRIEYGPGVRRKTVQSPLRAQRTGSGLQVETGALTVDLESKGTRLIGQASGCLGRDEIPQMSLTDAAGTSYTGRVESLEVEEENGLRLVVRAAGGFISADGSRPFDWVVRFYFFAHQPYVKLHHTFIHAADEPVFFQMRELKLRLPLAFADEPHLMLGSPPALPAIGRDVGPLPGGGVEMWEYDSDRYSIFGLPEGRVDCATKSHGWIYAADGPRAVQLKLRHPGENYPKLYAIDGKRLEIHLYPDAAGRTTAADGARTYADLHRRQSGDYDGPLQIPQGMAKTHELFLYCGPPAADLVAAALRAAAWQHPLLLEIDSAAYADSGALGSFPRHYPEFWLLEEKLRAGTVAGMTGPALTGMMNHGDFGLVSEGEKRVTLTTDNVGYDHLRAVLRQWLRRGEQNLFWLGEAMAFHFMEVDVVHHSTVHPAWVGGPRPIWQQCHHYRNTDHDALSRPGTDHTWFGGLLDFYYITGYRRTLEVIEEIGRYCAGTRQRNDYEYMTPEVGDAWEDPRQPTGPSPRKAGWALAGMADLYEMKPDPELAEEMRRMVAVFARWQDAEGRWRSQFGSFSRGTQGFMVAGIVNGLLRTWELLGDAQAKELCIRGCRFLATQVVNKDGLMYYKEAPINAFGPCFSNMDNFRAMVFAYAQTGDRAILRCMWRLFRAYLESGAHAGHEIKDVLWALPVFEREGLLEIWRDGV